MQAINLNILQVRGYSGLFLKLEIVKKIIAVIPIMIGIFWGINYMLWGAVCISLVSYILNSYYSGRLIDYSTVKQVKDIFPCFLVSSLVALLMWGITFLHFNYWVTLLLQVSVGILLAIVAYERMRLEEYKEIRRIILSIIRKNS